MAASSRTVRVFPDPGGVFLDGVPAVAQDVSEADALWMVASGAFTLAVPAAVKSTEAPAEAEPVVKEA